MVYLCDACDQISDFCHQQLLRKMRRKISWTDGRTDRGKTVYPPPPLGSGGIKNSVVNFDMLFFTHTNTYEFIYLEYWFQFEYGYGIVFREFLLTNRCQIILCFVYYLPLERQWVHRHVDLSVSLFASVALKFLHLLPRQHFCNRKYKMYFRNQWVYYSCLM
jgi:hypothetical protein